MTDFWRRLRQIVASRLAWRIAVPVLVTMLLVEAAIVVPSVFTYRENLIDRAANGAISVMSFLPPANEVDLTANNVAGIPVEMWQQTGIVGFMVRGAGGEMVRAFGEGVTIGADEVPRSGVLRRVSEDGDRIEVAQVLTTGLGRFTVLARADISAIHAELSAYAWRIGILVMLASLLIGGATLGLVGTLVIRPLFRIRNTLVRARTNPADAHRYRLKGGTSDEVGETYIAINELLFEVSRTHREQLATLWAIAQSADDGIVAFDMDGNLVFANAACLRLCNATSPEQLTDPDGPEFRTLDDEVLRLSAMMPGDQYSGEILLRRIGGETLPCLINARVVSNAAGKTVQRFAIFSDIAEIRAARQQLEFKNMQLESANRNKSEFLANVSHELRTPLNAIIGFSTIIRDQMFGQVGNVTYVQYAGDITHSGEHLLEIINALLDLRKIEAGEMELNEATVSPVELVRRTERMVAPIMLQFGHSIVTSFGPGLPDIVVDEQKIRQVLINLLSNAAKFSPDASTVGLDVRLEEKDEPSLVFSVIDQGIGMGDDEIEVALTTFGQIDSGLDRRYDGIGLGLPLSQALVDLHGGTLEFSSKPGKGTTVRVVLPENRFARARS